MVLTGQRNVSHSCPGCSEIESFRNNCGPPYSPDLSPPDFFYAAELRAIVSYFHFTESLLANAVLSILNKSAITSLKLLTCTPFFMILQSHWALYKYPPF